MIDFALFWNAGLHLKSGGTATVQYDYDYGSETWHKSFQVNVAPFADAEQDSTVSVDNWLTPVAGSNITFDPVDLTSIWYSFGDHNVFETSMGVGLLMASAPRTYDVGMLFWHDYAQWDVTELTQASTVPEPETLALTLLGLAGLASFRRKNPLVK